MREMKALEGWIRQKKEQNGKDSPGKEVLSSWKQEENEEDTQFWHRRTKSRSPKTQIQSWNETGKLPSNTQGNRECPHPPSQQSLILCTVLGATLTAQQTLPAARACQQWE